jgi:hypothetical protein
MRAAPFLFVPLALLAACGSTTRSTNLETGGFYVDYTVVEDGPTTGARAVATFRDREATGTDLELVGGDAITVDGKALTLIDDYNATVAELGGFRYEAVVPSGVLHTFVFSRVGEPDVRRVIAPAPAIVPLFDGAPTARRKATDPAILAWKPDLLATVTLRVKATTADANCLSPTLATFDDVGFYAIDPARLRVAGATVACTFTIEATRRKRTVPDPAPFLGGGLTTVVFGAAELTIQ